MSKQQEKRDQAARAAWLYYVGNHTQQDIAEQLGVSRQIAQRLIAYAVEPVSYTHLTLPTKEDECRSRWSPYH